MMNRHTAHAHGIGDLLAGHVLQVAQGEDAAREGRQLLVDIVPQLVKHHRVVGAIGQGLTACAILVCKAFPHPLVPNHVDAAVAYAGQQEAAGIVAAERHAAIEQRGEDVAHDILALVLIIEERHRQAIHGRVMGLE